MENRNGFWRKLSLDFHQLTIGILIILLGLLMSILIPNFFTPYNIRAMINNFILEAIMALGMTMVIISGGIDLSVSGVLPFSALMFAILMKQNVPIAVAALIVLILGGVIGLINSSLIQWLKIAPFIVTMATMLTLKGLNLAISGGNVISKFPTKFNTLVRFEFLTLPLPIWIFIILAILYWYFSRNHELFLKIYLVGNNSASASYSGISTANVLNFVYVQSSILAALAGILATTMYNSASFSFAQGAESRVITAVALGGTSLTKGGVGKISGTLLGCLFLSIVYNGFIMSGISTYYQDVVTGGMLVLAILFSEQAKAFRTKSFPSIRSLLPISKN